MKNKIIAFLLIISICAGLMPATALATEDVESVIDATTETTTSAVQQTSTFKLAPGIGSSAPKTGTYNHYTASSGGVNYSAIKNGSVNGQSGRVTTFKFTYKKSQYTVGVYLPYGYDANDTSKAYNVVIWEQGKSLSFNPTTFLAKGYAKQACDYLISSGIVEPFLVFEIYYKYASDKNFLGTFIPLIQQQYNVYGSRFVPGDDIRNHYALAGCSSGASYVMTIGLNRYMDLFANFAIISYLGAGGIQEYILNNIKNSGKRINVAFTASGDTVDQWGNNEKKALKGSEKKINDLKQYADYAEWWTYNGYTHGDWHVSTVGFARFIAVSFGGMSSDASSIAATSTFIGEETFSADAAQNLAYFAEKRGWDLEKMFAASWYGEDGNIYRRADSHQTEHYADAVQTDIDTCIQLGILDETSGYNGSASSIVEIALAEAAASDNGEQPPGSNRSKYNTWYYGQDQEAAWCAIFVSYCAYRAGLLKGADNCVKPLFKKTAGVRNIRNWFVNDCGFAEYKGVAITQLGGSAYTAKLGDIFCFYNEEENCLGHVGIVTQVTDSSFSVTQGNTGNGQNDKVKTITYTSASSSWVGNGIIIDMRYPAAQEYSFADGTSFGNLTEEQQTLLDYCLKVAQNPSVLAAKYRQNGYCAGFVNGIYKSSGVGEGGGDAYEYWTNWHTSGSSDLSEIPIGAVVVGSEPIPLGHIGIYIGHSLVIHYTLGDVCVWPLWNKSAYTDTEWEYITAHARNWNGRQSFNNYSACWNGGWCWPQGEALGRAKNPTKTK